MVGGIFCDLKKAFDNVDQAILLSKLKFYGIRGKFHELITSYLENRYQRVSINSKNPCLSSYSRWGKIKCGVPQGSILGPLLFLLYINDLGTVFRNNHKPILFADDTSLIVTHNDLTEFSRDVTSAFNSLNKWFAANLLSLNLNKTQYVQFMTKNTPIRDISISHNNMLISKTSNTKFLGLIITDSLSWKDHITQLIPKLSTACYILRCIRPYMSLEALKCVYHSYFHSLLSYGLIFWGNSSFSSHIFRLQKKAIRVIMGLGPRDSFRKPFKHLRILPLQSQYIFSLLMFVVENKNIFQINSEIHDINTRQNSILYQPQANLTLYQKGAYYSGIKIFNNLPPPY